VAHESVCGEAEATGYISLDLDLLCSACNHFTRATPFSVDTLTPMMKPGFGEHEHCYIQ
jgi:hypothetical protein